MNMNKKIVDIYSRHRWDAPYAEDYKSSVHFADKYSENRYRFHKAQDEVTDVPPTKDKVRSVCGDFFAKAEIHVTIIKSAPAGVAYRNSIWIKFLETGHIGVVGLGLVNFDIPPSDAEYDEKNEDGSWKWNPSGILVHQLGHSWDESGVLVLQINDVLEECTLEQIKRALGNWMIVKGLHIVDHYNHQIEKREYSGN